MKKAEIETLIDRWQAGNVVTAEQAKFMKSDLATFTSEHSGNRFISAIMYIGSTGLALGALLLIASNWAGLSDGIKLILSLLLPVLPLCFAYWRLVVVGEDRVLARAANILGVALIGGTLALIGQIYHLEANMQSFLWTWAILSAPFVFVFEKKENVLISAVLVGAAVLFSLFEFLDDSNVTGGTAVVLITLVALLYSYIMYAVGAALRSAAVWADSGRLMRLGGASIAVITLFVTTFEYYARAIVEGSYDPYSYTYTASADWQMLSIALNLFFIGFLVFVLFRATKFEEYGLAFTVVRVMGFYLLVKYCTLFYSMFDTGLFFIVGGVLFILGGWFLERNKKTFMSYMRSKSAPATTYAP